MSNARFILLLVATLSLAASGYVINNYFDVKTYNQPTRESCGRKGVLRRVVLLWHVVLLSWYVLGRWRISRKENYTGCLFLS